MIAGGVAKVAEKADLYRIKAVGLVFYIRVVLLRACMILRNRNNSTGFKSMPHKSRMFNYQYCHFAHKG